MKAERRSGCPISLSLEVFGDRWSLLILRDMMFAGRRHFREFLHADEGISSNILADRLRTLTEQGMITRVDDPTHKQKAIYSLTEMSIALVPVFVQIGRWGSGYLRADEALSVPAQVLSKGGPAMQERFMDELRAVHLGDTTVADPGPGEGSVAAAIEAAYEEVVARTDPA